MPTGVHTHDDIYDPDSLADWVVDRAKVESGRKIIFLVGSPLSEPASGSDIGVANVTHMVDLVLRKIQDQRPREAAELRRMREEEILDGELYQRAMNKLGEVFDESVVNEAVRAGVVGSVLPGQYSQESLLNRLSDVAFLRELEQRHEVWSLRPGVDALGRLLKAKLPGIAPIVLTSNFDPLIEVAIRRHGGTPQTIKFDRDGVLDNLDIHGPQITVIHFHGWWLEGNTLHTGPMLAAGRPSLEAAIERLLGDFFIVPIAYGGWLDVFTKALHAACGRERPVDVRWGVYPRNKAMVRGSCAHLMSQYAPNRVRFYRGVDCHSFFPDLVARLSPAPSLPAVEKIPSKSENCSQPRVLLTADVSSLIDWEAVEVLRRAVEARSPGSTGTGDPWNFLEKKQGLLIRDDHGHLSIPTETIILLGTKDSIRLVLERPVVDFQVRQAEAAPDPTVRWAGRDNIEENLVRARLRLLEGFASANRDQLANGRIQGATSGVASDIPGYISFREAAINLLVHQDYENKSTKGLIELGPYGWHFENAGCPNVSKADLAAPTPIPYRNPLINRAFRDAGWTENGKTGLRAMNAEWMRMRRAPPCISLLQESDRFRVEFSFEERAPIQATAWISQLGMSPTEVQSDFLSLLANRKFRAKEEFQLALALPAQEFGALIRWGELQGVVDSDALRDGAVVPTEAFALRMPDFSRATWETDHGSEPSEINIGDLDDIAIHILRLLGDGLMTTPRFQEATRQSRPTVRKRLNELFSLGLVRLDQSSKTHIWTLSENGERAARAIGR